MKVAFDVFVEPDLEPRPATEAEHTLGLHLRHGFVEMGPRRSAISRVRFAPGEIRLSIRHREQWLGAVDLDLVRISISDAALTAVCGEASGDVELRRPAGAMDTRIGGRVPAASEASKSSWTRGSTAI